MYRKIFFLLLLTTVVIIGRAQNINKIPKVYSNITLGDEDKLYLNLKGSIYVSHELPSPYTLENLKGNPQATPTGIFFDFNEAVINGNLYYGFIPFEDTKYPLPVYFRSPQRILDSKAFINIHALKGRYDMIGWVKNQKGVLGYRVVNENGDFLYDGRIGFRGENPIFIDDTIIEGPFVNLLGHEEATISFETNFKIVASIEINNKKFSDEKATTHHEIKVEGLSPKTEYEYSVHYGNNSLSYSLKTAPLPGTRSQFTFGYASDSRSGQGGGERDFHGANAYIMKKIMSLSAYKESAFVQFTGDLITGYKIDPNELNVEYANWKRAVEPWAHHLSVVSTMGNHEALMAYWAVPGGDFFSVDKFPFEEVSSEAVYAQNFVNPLNGPESEDGAYYDPDKKRIDFPPYKETVYYYTYDNIAMVVLNSDYWYAPSTSHVDVTSGNIHAYIMDIQLKWIEETIEKLEQDDNIDHIFVTEHTPFFPNGGHVNDDMWYGGNNIYRPYVAGKPVKKGIIERRDELLDIIVNKSKKTVALLTGDEHNYCKTELTPETNIYPDNWELPKIKISRTVYQINNGAAGAPYYAQENTPWTPFVTGFTTQHALVLFHVDGEKIFMEVLNPDTLDKVDELQLR